MIQGETEKAAAILENALVELNVYNLGDGDPLLCPSSKNSLASGLCILLKSVNSFIDFSSFLRKLCYRP